MGSGVQFTGFNSLNTTKNIQVIHDYINLTPTVNFSTPFPGPAFPSELRGRTGTPSATQLQPLTTIPTRLTISRVIRSEAAVYA